jgi:hypothetical protein
MIAVPDWLEQTVRKSEKEDVLDGFLAEIVIYPIDLVFPHHLLQDAIEVPC